jgi:hypothetical protein
MCYMCVCVYIYIYICMYFVLATTKAASVISQACMYNIWCVYVCVCVHMYVYVCILSCSTMKAVLC